VTALIDGGDTDRGDGLVAWLRSMGIDSVDWIMPSHPHIDHIAGLTTVLEQMEVRGALVSDQPNNTAAYRRQMQLIADKGVPLTAANDQVVLQLGAFVTAQVLSPPSFLLPTAEPEEDNSVILRVCLVVICTLFTGDIGDQGERYVIARYSDTPDMLRSQILKVSHHGSAEPNNPALLAMIQPEVALIGVGAGNPFGHPTQRALDRVGATGATIYRTDLHGTILVEIYEDRYTVTPLPDVEIASTRRPAAQPTSVLVPVATAQPASSGSRPIGTRTGQPVRSDPNGPDRDCGEFSTWAEAQDFFEAAGGPATDRHRLDSDRDGVACESLPGAPRP
jgi:competence protein ComEC